ncbi:hypothetical protein [Neorhizobium galegae]|uniref:hypothetical protein n=1 Tax=Neorhizobium galegae TaxID=399 RepID=UPI000621ED0A|nr:hypothetical protein [Neorhizobium galegae]CDZ55274.1 Hypothetical protein NGAL_HAMBI2566_00080 [Neorhizobium galegae bv. orientalis]MCQ1572423.1 hypothetical protein [Neorhizobium galegae]MCQ1806039.1 hypothetical protein [Neorhizobium galegae]MCQ1836897.1 hypothetical protein [Neorhizobium galegae]UIK07309.1 hypothetical protein LZK81_10270 [Neorhizobium galegae]
MKFGTGLAAVILAVTMFGAQAARADQLIEEYSAFIGEDDLYNSNNVRLQEPWQIVRQDRANFHRFGVSQRGDQSDSFFDDAGNRELVERMISRGTIDRAARNAVVRGNVMINVQIFRGPRGDYVNVLVY